MKEERKKGGRERRREREKERERQTDRRQTDVYGVKDHFRTLCILDKNVTN